MSSSIPIRSTERLLLRPFMLADAPTVQELAGAPEVAATTLNMPHPYPEGAAEAWIGTHEQNAADGRGYTWAIVRASDGVLMGALSMMLTPAHGRAELGYWLGVPYWGQGYMTEAARSVVLFGLESLGLHRVGAGCFPRNRASSRVMEKAGMTYEGTLRGYVRKGEAFEAVAMYAILRGQ